MESKLQKPPFFKNWKGLYLFVIGFLAILIILFKLLTNSYN